MDLSAETAFHLPRLQRVRSRRLEFHQLHQMIDCITRHQYVFFCCWPNDARINFPPYCYRMPPNSELPSFIASSELLVPIIVESSSLHIICSLKSRIEGLVGVSGRRSQLSRIGYPSQVEVTETHVWEHLQDLWEFVDVSWSFGITISKLIEIHRYIWWSMQQIKHVKHCMKFPKALTASPHLMLTTSLNVKTSPHIDRRLDTLKAHAHRSEGGVGSSTILKIGNFLIPSTPVISRGIDNL